MMKNVLLAFFIVFSSGLFHFSIAFLPMTHLRKRCIRCHSEPPSEQNKGEKMKSTAFERSLNDFIGKRYGAGEAFYGKRQSSLSEEEYQNARALNAKPSIDENAEFKSNAILVVCGTESIGQWVTFDLVEKGFTVRVASLSRKAAMSVYGLPGNNVDIIELKATQAEYDESAFLRAISGVQAVIFCSNFDNDCKEESNLSALLLKAMVKKRVAGQLDVRKIVCLSRVVPKRWASTEKNFDSVFKGLFGGRKTDRKQHEDLEAQIRNVSIDYVVVRAPPSCDETREGASEDLLLLQGDEAGAQYSDLGIRVADVSRDSGGLSIGILDLAECLVQSLIQDVSGATFTVCANPSGQIRQADLDNRPIIQSTAMEAVYGPSPPKREKGEERIRRESYYGILEMADVDMKTSYMLRPADAYKAQIVEDINVEQYWTEKLKGIGRDV